MVNAVGRHPKSFGAVRPRSRLSADQAESPSPKLAASDALSQASVGHFQAGDIVSGGRRYLMQAISLFDRSVNIFSAESTLINARSSPPADFVYAPSPSRMNPFFVDSEGSDSLS